MRQPAVTMNPPNVAESAVFVALEGVLPNLDIRDWVETSDCRYIVKGGRRCKRDCQSKQPEAFKVMLELAELPEVDYTDKLKCQVAQLVELVHCWQHTHGASQHFERWWADKTRSDKARSDKVRLDKVRLDDDVFCDTPPGLPRRDSNPKPLPATIDNLRDDSVQSTGQDDDRNFNEDGDELELPPPRPSQFQEESPKENINNPNYGSDFNPHDSSPISDRRSVNGSSTQHHKYGSSAVTPPSVSPPRFDLSNGITTPSKIAIRSRILNVNVHDTPTKVISRTLTDRLQVATTTRKQEDDEEDDEQKAQDTTSASDVKNEKEEDQVKIESDVTLKEEEISLAEKIIPSDSVELFRKPQAKTPRQHSDVLFDPHIGQIRLPNPDFRYSKWRLLQKIEAPFKKLDRTPGRVYVRKHNNNSSYCKVGFTENTADERYKQERCTAYLATECPYESPQVYIGAHRVEQLVLEDMKRYNIKFVECCCYATRQKTKVHREWFHIDCETMIKKVQEWEAFVLSGMYTLRMISELGTRMLDTTYVVTPQRMLQALSELPGSGAEGSVIALGQVAVEDDSTGTEDKSLPEEKKADEDEAARDGASGAELDEILPEWFVDQLTAATEVIRRSIDLTTAKSSIEMNAETTIISKENGQKATSTHHEQTSDEREETSVASQSTIISRVLARKDSNVTPLAASRRSESTTRPREGTKDSIAQGVGKLKQHLRQIFKRSVTNKQVPLPSHSGNWNRGRSSTTMDGHTSTKGPAIKVMMQRRLSTAWPMKPLKDEPIAREQDAPRLGRVARAWTFR